MNDVWYRDDHLAPFVVPYAGSIGENFILMDDNARTHRARVVNDFLQEQGIIRMEWPEYSPDLNPIENLWDIIGARVRNSREPPRTLNDLRQAVIEQWDALIQNVINRCIRNMRQRCNAVIQSICGHTRY